jgi:hypothetical protein
MRTLRVLFVFMFLIGAVSTSSLMASARPQRPCTPFPACFFDRGDDDDGDDGDDDGDDGDDDGDEDEGDGGSTGGIADFTFGAGTAVFGPPPDFQPSDFVFAAVSGPNGENASGFAEANSAFGRQFAGPVTCLRVSGNRAAFEVDSNSPPDGADVVFFVADNTPGIDEFNFDFISGQADATCPDPTIREQSVVAGDIVVGDNQPFPSGGDNGDDGDDEDED